MDKYATLTSRTLKVAAGFYNVQRALIDLHMNWIRVGLLIDIDHVICYNKHTDAF